MVFKPRDIKHLEIMANLANASPKPRRQLDVKKLIAADQSFHQPTTNEKIMLLCSKLRKSGFEKQADNLENKFLLYKAADVHLYRAHDEDGEDVIEFAHPDGDHKVEDAGDELGYVETILSQHKKDVEVATKAPTGKQGSIRLHTYVDECKKIIKKEAIYNPIAISIAVWIWSKTRRINQGVKKNVEILQSEIDGIKDSEYIAKSAHAKSLMQQVEEDLNYLSQLSTTFDGIAVSPEASSLKFIEDYEKFINTVINKDLDNLNKLMQNIRNIDEKTTTVYRAYRSFIASPFEDVQKAIIGLQAALKEMSSTVMNAKIEAMQDKTFPSEAPPISPPKASTKSEQGITQLTAFETSLNKKDVSVSKKQQGLDWIKKQKEEFASTKDDKSLDSLLAENKEFQQDWGL